MTTVTRRLERTIAATAGGGLLLIGGAAVAVGPLLARNGLAFAAVAGASWVFLCASLWRKRALNNLAVATRAGSFPPALTAPTWVTLARGLLICLVAGLLPGPHPARDAVGWLAGALYTTAVIGDGLDGALARRTGTTTRMGAAQDITTDALGLLLAPLLAVTWGQLPPWYLLLSAAYPLFRFGLWARAGLGLPAHPERLRPDPRARLLAGVQMGVVAASLFPVLPRGLLWAAATLAMLPTLVLFTGEWRLATAPSAPLAQARAQPGDR
jgi:CDP-diacylglycerol--glycerol-3-phosphate 3-phosphatidyltransferase